MVKLTELLDARNQHISKALSIGHGKPLHIVRGEMQYLYMVLTKDDIDMPLRLLDESLGRVDNISDR
jgi:hypothetical protein